MTISWPTEFGFCLSVQFRAHYRMVVDVFIDVADIGDVFHVVGHTETPYAR